MVDVENRVGVATSEVHPAPSSNSVALRVSGLKLENSSSVSNPTERIRASNVSAFERKRVHAPQQFPVGFRNGAWHGEDSVIVEAERE